VQNVVLSLRTRRLALQTTLEAAQKPMLRTPETLLSMPLLVAHPPLDEDGESKCWFPVARLFPCRYNRQKLAKYHTK
jgi:hypothetical protein